MDPPTHPHLRKTQWGWETWRLYGSVPNLSGTLKKYH